MFVFMFIHVCLFACEFLITCNISGVIKREGRDAKSGVSLFESWVGIGGAGGLPIGGGGGGARAKLI